MKSLTLVCAASIALAACAASSAEIEHYDVLIRNGTVYDGTGTAGVRTDVGIRQGRVAAVRDLSSAQATTVIDATDLTVAPGFINMLSWQRSR